MNILFTSFIGVLLTFMIFLNASLTESIGMVPALMFIHIAGLTGVLVISLISKTKIKYDKTLPFYLYLGGCLGVITVLCNSYTFLVIGASLTTSLGLLGQTISSIVVDHYGLLGAEKKPFNKDKIAGLLVILVGIIVMGVL